MNKYLPLLIASALLASACSKEKTTKKEKVAETAATQEVIVEKETKIVPTEQMDKPVPALAVNHAENTMVHTAPQPNSSRTHSAVSQQAALDAGLCHATTDGEIAGLFDRWNASLKTGKSDIVVSNYAPDSILLPTVSNKVRHSAAEKADYFDHFLENSPVGEINERYIKIGCNTALDAGVYTFHFSKTGTSVTGRYSFTYEWNGNKWLITSHHSSVMPEQAAKEQAKAQENAGKESTH